MLVFFGMGGECQSHIEQKQQNIYKIAYEGITLQSILTKQCEIVFVLSLCINLSGNSIVFLIFLIMLEELLNSLVSGIQFLDKL